MREALEKSGRVVIFPDGNTVASVNAELIGHTCQRHIFGDGVVGNEHICPRLATVAQRMACGVAAPFHSSVFLGLNLGILHVVASLGFEHLPEQDENENHDQDRPRARLGR